MIRGTLVTRSVRLVITVAVAAVMLVPVANAHLMVAQHGTLNFVGTGGFVVMALSVDAFNGVDDDGDGRMSVAEMHAHKTKIEDQVQRGLQLIGDDGPHPLEALMLNLSPDDAAHVTPAAHLVALGRFSITDNSREALSRLKLRLTLLGQTAETQEQIVTVRSGDESHKVTFTPDREEFDLFH